MKRYTDEVVSASTGLPLIGTAIRVRMAGTANNAVLYETDNIAGPTLPNPISSDNNGKFAFYIADGDYDLLVTSPNGQQRSLTDVEIYDFASLRDRLNDASDKVDAAIAATALAIQQAGYAGAQGGYALTQANFAQQQGAAAQQVVLSGASILAAKDAAVGAAQQSVTIYNDIADSINAAASLLTAEQVGLLTGLTGVDAAVIAASATIVRPAQNINRAGGVNKATLAGLGIVSLTRAAAAYALNNSGIYQRFAADTLRVTDAGILIEGDPATNLGTGIDFSGWATSNVGQAIVKTPGVGPALDDAGAMTGTRIAYGGSPAGFGYGVVASLPAGLNTFVYIDQPGDERYTSYEVYANGTPTPMVVVDWQAVGGPASIVTSGSVASRTITPIANGRYLIVHKINFGLSVTSFSCQTRRSNSYASPTGAGGTPGQTLITRFLHNVFVGGTASSPILAANGVRPADIGSIALGVGYPKNPVYVNSAQRLRSQLASLTAITTAELSALAQGAPITLLAALQVPDTSLTKPTESGSTVYMVADNASGTFFWNGVYFVSEAKMMEAAGGTGTGLGSSPTFVLANYIAPDAPSLIAPTNFTVDAQGFDQYVNSAGGGTTVSVEGGYLKVTAPGTTNVFASASRAIKVPSGFAYQVTATARLGTANPFSVAIGAEQAFFGYSQGAGVTSTSDVTVSAIASGNTGNFVVIGITALSAVANGTMYVKDFIVKQVRPAKGFPSSSFMVEQKGTMPALPAAAQVLFQTDDGSEQARLRMELRVDGSVHGTHRIGSGLQSFDATLGTVTGGQAFTAILGRNSSTTRGAINGTGQEQEGIIAAGPSAFRIGRSFTGEQFTGAISRYRVFNGLETVEWMKRNTSAMPADALKLWLEGDSGTAFGTGWASLLSDLGFDVFNTGAGGSTSNDQTMRTLNAANLAIGKDRTAIWWDLDANGRAATWTGSINGDTMFVTANADRGLRRGHLVTGSGVAAGTRIVRQITTTETDGSYGGKGVWEVSGNQTVASTAMSGTIVGTSEYDVADIADRIAARGNDRWIWVQSCRTDAADMFAVGATLKQKYGAIHLFDPRPIANAFAISDPAAPGYATDQAVIAAGGIATSVTYDGVHLKTEVRRAVAFAIVAQIVAIATGRNQIDDYCRSWPAWLPALLRAARGEA